MAGCGNHGKNSSAIPTENTVTETASNQSTETTDWEPATHKTVNNLNGVTMNVKGETTSSTGLTIEFRNDSGNQCIYGDYFSLEKKINESWYKVPAIMDSKYGFNSIGHRLASGDDSEWAVDWSWLYGSLDIGNYRIVKDIQNFRGAEEYDTYYLAAEFTICSNGSKKLDMGTERIKFK